MNLLKKLFKRKATQEGTPLLVSTLMADIFSDEDFLDRDKYTVYEAQREIKASCYALHLSAVEGIESHIKIHAYNTALWALIALEAAVDGRVR